jgi:hypothetical protein
MPIFSPMMGSVKWFNDFICNELLKKRCKDTIFLDK